MRSIITTLLCAVLFASTAHASAPKAPAAKWVYSGKTDYKTGSIIRAASVASDYQKGRPQLVLMILSVVPDGDEMVLISNRPLPYCRTSCAVNVDWGNGTTTLSSLEFSLDENRTGYSIPQADQVFMMFEQAGSMDVSFPGDSKDIHYKFQYDGYDPNRMR